MKQIISFFFLLTTGFILIAQFVGYKIFGDFFSQSYKNYSYTIIRIFGAFYRGSLDDDYALNNNYNTKDLSKVPHSSNFDGIISQAYSPFKSLPYHTGYEIYCLYSIVFYFFSNFIIKVVFIGFFLKIYKNIDVEEKEREERRIIKEEKEKENVVGK